MYQLFVAPIFLKKNSVVGHLHETFQVFADHVKLFGRPFHICDKNYILNKI
jgi:hypothetical protein